MHALIKPRRDTLDNFIKLNPILAKGELAIVFYNNEEDTNYGWIKIGDGKRDFNNLPWLGYNHIQNIIKDIKYNKPMIVMTNSYPKCKFKILDEKIIDSIEDEELSSLDKMYISIITEKNKEIEKLKSEIEKLSNN